MIHLQYPVGGFNPLEKIKCMFVKLEYCPQYFWDENVGPFAQSWPSMLVPAGICLQSAGQHSKNIWMCVLIRLKSPGWDVSNPRKQRDFNYQSQLVSLLGF